MKGKGEQIDLETGEIGVHSTPAIVRDVVIVGVGDARRRDRRRPTTTPRGWSARSTCGPASCSGSSTPFRGRASSATTRGRRSRGPTTATSASGRKSRVDEELGLVYLPVETPSSDFYGGHRPGNNLFAESLVCVDLKTGQRKWHFQLVHHPIWNFDNSSAPMLLDITVDGRADQGGGAAEQAGVALRLRSRDRSARVADRGAAGAAVRRARREDCRRRSRFRPSRRPTRATTSRCRTI